MGKFEKDMDKIASDFVAGGELQKQQENRNNTSLKNQVTNIVNESFSELGIDNVVEDVSITKSSKKKAREDVDNALSAGTSVEIEEVGSELKKEYPLDDVKNYPSRGFLKEDALPGSLDVVEVELDGGEMVFVYGFQLKKASKKKATGEMSQESIEEGGEYYEWAKFIEEDVKEIEKMTNGKLTFEEMKPFDKYQGPYARVTIDGAGASVWGYEEGGMYYIEDREWYGDTQRLADAINGKEGAVELVIKKESSIKLYNYDKRIPIEVVLDKNGKVFSVKADFDDYEKKLEVDNFQVVISDVGKYKVRAISKDSAFKQVLSGVFDGVSHIMIQGSNYTLKDAKNILKLSDVIRVSDIPAKVEKEATEPSKVVELVEYEPQLKHISPDEKMIDRDLPDIGMSENEATRVNDDVLISSYKNQVVAIVDDHLKEMNIPVEIEEVELKIKDDNNIDGVLTSDGEFCGSFGFTGTVKNEKVLIVKADFDLLKGYFGVKTYQADLGDVGIYEVEDREIKSATIRMLATVGKKISDISFEGMRLSEATAEKMAERLIDNGQIDEIGIYPYPDVTVLKAGEDNPDTDLKAWSVVDDDGKKVLVRK